MSDSERNENSGAATPAAGNGKAAEKTDARASDASASGAETTAAASAGASAAGNSTDAPKPKRKHRGAIITCAVVAVVAVLGVGFSVWHAQPSFCNAICHDPMDPYLTTYEATPGEPATDKWGNEVSDASSMLASVHRQAGKTCLDCHVPTLDEQINEGEEWVSGSYNSPLSERTTAQLLEARGIDDANSFCTNETCHNYSHDNLVNMTSWMGTINPHLNQHGEQKCSTCHKAHRASVMYCTQCHTEAVVPDGWLSYQESEALDQPSY